MQDTRSDPAERLATLLERSDEFESALAACFPEVGVVLQEEGPKYDLCRAACALSTEHASVLRSAFALLAPNTGAALLRLQFEGLLRAAWLLHAATPEHIEKLAKTLDLEAEQAAKRLPGYMDMLVAIERHGPAGLSAPLSEFNVYSRHALNSFVHTGIHPLRRAREGFPTELAVKIIVFSNGLLHFAYRLLAALTGSQRRMDGVTRLYLDFRDCLPMKPDAPDTGEGAA